MIPPPAGYVPLRVGTARAVVRRDAAEGVHRALAAGTLYGFAAGHPARQALQGRGVAYAVPLEGGPRVVVRHNRHGGLLAGLTGDRFLAPTRAPRELATALRLAGAGVPTPHVVAIVRYRAGGPFERADVATELVDGATDLAHVLLGEPLLHAAAARAAGTLLRQLAGAGARHADLNIKNVLLQPAGAGVRAWVLDVDRVTFHDRGRDTVALRNWRRFERSARKWRERHGAAAGEDWLAVVRERALAPR